MLPVVLFLGLLSFWPEDDAYVQAVRAFQEGRFTDVLRDLSSLPSQDGERPPVYNLRALALMELGRFDEALHASEDSRRLDPDNVNYIYNAGMIYVAKKDLRGAEALFGPAIRRFPMSSRLHEGWGEVLFAVKRFAEAAVEFRKAAEYDPANASAQVSLAKLSDIINDREQFGAAAGRAVRLAPENSLACYYYGKYLLDQPGGRGEARDYIRKSITLAPHFADGLIAMGGLLGEEGKWGEAARSYEEALRSDPSNGVVYYRLHAAYRKLGNVDKAQWALQQYQRLAAR